jgi:hypothetical protein
VTPSLILGTGIGEGSVAAVADENATREAMSNTAKHIEALSCGTRSHVAACVQKAVYPIRYRAAG